MRSMDAATRRMRLGEHVRAQRRALGLSVADAARIAGVNRMTWDGLEKGTRDTRDQHYAAIERTLRWRRGSIEAVLSGQRPIVLADDEQAEDQPEFDDPDEQAIWEMVGLEEEERRKLIAFLRADRQIQRSTRRPA